MFALINRDLTDTGKRKAQVDIVAPADLHPDKPYWVPIVVEVTDDSTGPDTVASPWVETVEVARLLRSRTIRDKTPGELDAEDQARVDSLMLERGAMRALATLQFQIINDVRALEGKAAITAEQYKTRLWKLIRG